MREMTSFRTGTRRGLPSMIALGMMVPMAAAGQNQAVPPRTAPTTLPGLDDFNLPGTVTRPATPPTPMPSPTAAPRPTATSSPRPAPTVARRAPADRPIPTPTPQASAVPLPLSTPTAAPGAAIIPPVLAITGPTPTPTAVPNADTGAIEPEARSNWPWVIGALALLLAGAFAVHRFRRRERDEEPEAEPFDIAVPEPDEPPLDLTEALQPAPPVEEAPPSFFRRSQSARAQLVLELEARRAGTNLTSGAVDYVARIRNDGRVTAEDVRLDLKMITAAAGQDALIARLLADAIEKPVVAPFAVAPGEAVDLGGMALIPREAIGAVPAAEGRSLFVPVVTLNARYRWRGTIPGEGHTGASFALGRSRGEGAKLAPFRLDGPPRMWTEVGVLRYPVGVSE